MIAARLIPYLCIVWLWAALGLVANQPTCAASPPVWQPYRQQPAAKLPAEYVVQRSPASIPVEVITDYELNQLSAHYCEVPHTISTPYIDPLLGQVSEIPAGSSQPDTLELLPSDLIWHSYLAGVKEPRIAGVALREAGNDVSLLDVTLGGRTSVLRYGWRQNGRPLGWELQLEGAAILRLNLDENWDFDAADFRFGVPLIYAPNELLHWKAAYYHLSSHVGDEFLVRNPGFTRINFSRDVLVLGASYFPLPAWRWYAEAGYAFYESEGSEQWEFQFGLDYSQPGPTGTRGTPFAALNGHLREEVDFGGNLVVQAGWLWRGQTGRVLRTGLHYYNGKSSQLEFFNQFEQQIGWGLWQEY